MKVFRICILIVAILGAVSCSSVPESAEAPEKEAPEAVEKEAPPSPPAEATATIGGSAVTITYSSPRVRGREGQLFGAEGRIGQDRNYPVWRAGANSATALHTDGDLDIGGVAVPAGDYTLYVNLANPEAWELIINQQTGQWGLEYDAAQDVGRAPMTMSKPPAMVENLTYTLSDAGDNTGTLTLEWENHSASVPITVK